MNDFPLHEFLAKLSDGGLRPTVRDWDRLSRAFGQGGDWTLRRLKHVLTALLARDPDQQRWIGRQFDRFFDPEILDRKLPPESGIREILRAWADRSDGDPSPPVVPGTGPVSPSPPAAPKRFPERLSVVFFLLLSVALVAECFLLPLRPRKIQEPAPPPVTEPVSPSVSEPDPSPVTEPDPPTIPKPAPEFRLHPSAIAFGGLAPGEERVAKFFVSNAGNAPLRIVEMAIVRDEDGAFRPDFPTMPATLEPGAERAVSVGFRPPGAGDFSGEIRISHDAADEPATVSLRGSGTPPGTVFRRVPHVAEIRREPLEASATRRTLAGIAAVFLLSALWWGIRLRRLEKPPPVEAPKFDPEKERFFHPGEIGGTPEPRLDEATLAELADSMGYFRSEAPSRILDAAASVRATVRRGGIPDCRFFRRKQLRTLLILEDEASEARTWNPMARDLADGMKRYGVHVRYGIFRGSPDLYRDRDGREHFLEDLEDRRRGVLVLLFTDGKGFARPRNALALEGLARWPMKAWMDLREPRFWDEALEPAIRHEIPVYPATRDGLLRAMRRYLTERGGDDRPTRALIRERRLPGMSTRFGLEHFLGDALSWAMDCSIMQPAPAGLADALRREFHPHLPPEAMERLYALDNSSPTKAGIRFSRAVQKRLREGLQARRTRAQRRKVAEFILRKIDESKPENAAEDSLARLSWEAVRVRVAAETGAEGALKRLAELARTPLGQFLGDSFGDYGLPGANEGERAPLLERPESVDGKRWLRGLPGNPVGVGSPVAWRQRAVLGVLAACFWGFSGWAVRDGSRPLPNWEIQVAEPDLAGAEAVLEARTNGEWREEMRGALGTLGGTPLAVGREYRLRIPDAEAPSETTFRVGRGEKTVLFSAGKDVATTETAASGVPAGEKPGDTWTEPHTGMTFVWVPGGTFQMGCGDWQKECFGDEKPVSEVTLSGFWMGKYEVTVGEFQRFLRETNFGGDGRNAWRCKDMTVPEGMTQADNHPVACVSWNEAVAFAKWLSERNDGEMVFRLPTEAEWEYACRSGGKDQRYCGGDDIGSVAWYSVNSGSTTHSVGTKAANGLELHDMSGNVWEWCQDWYGAYSEDAKANPPGPSGDSLRVLRGGSWNLDAWYCRSTYRHWNSPGLRLAYIGFRLVLPPVRQGRA